VGALVRGTGGGGERKKGEGKKGMQKGEEKGKEKVGGKEGGGEGGGEEAVKETGVSRLVEEEANVMEGIWVERG